MKTVVILLVSSLFLSNMPNNKENDSIKKVMTYKIENIEKIKGKAFNIGGGIKYSLSLIELFTILEDVFKINAANLC